MPVPRRRAPKDEYAIFETLRAKGVSVAPFATVMEDIGNVGIPAVLAVRYTGRPAVRVMVAKYGDIVPAVAKAAKAKGFFMQKHVTGHEVACGVITEGRKILPLVPVDAIPRPLHESGAWHMAPAVQDAVQALAKGAHKALGIKGHSCVRLVVEGAVPYVTGVDAAPPLSHAGLFMRSALLAGFTAEEVYGSVGPNSLAPKA